MIPQSVLQGLFAGCVVLDRDGNGPFGLRRAAWVVHGCMHECSKARSDRDRNRAALARSPGEPVECRRLVGMEASW
jgi:hypothetical protein